MTCNYSAAAKLRLLLLFLAAALAAHAQRVMTVADVVAFVKSQIKMKRDDRTTADFLLRRVKLTEKLDTRTVEDLQGLGAGFKTVQALKQLSEDSAKLAAVPPPKAPPPPNSIEQAEILDAMRSYALNYTKGLPNYMCVRITHRRIEPTQSGYLPYGDEVRETLTFFDGQEAYKVEMINGKSVTNIDRTQLGGVISSGEFGSMLYRIFYPATGTRFAWDHWATLRGKRMYVFAFKVPQASGYTLYHGVSNREYTSAYNGVIYADVQTKAIMRIKMDCVGIPRDYPIHEVGLTLDYRPTKIADQEFVVPFHFSLHSTEVKAVTKNEADYRLYRKFGADATITFTDAEPIPEDQLKEQPVKP